VVVDPDFDWKRERVCGRCPGIAHRLRNPCARLHKLHPGVPEGERGTFAGLAHQTWWATSSRSRPTVELLPVHTFVNDAFLLERKLTNYWGYNSIGFFAPDPRYASNAAKSLQEFKEMVARFHDAGLEVVIDVVYNHTAEGNEKGPTLSFRGIDNASYYQPDPGQEALLHQ